MSYRPGDKVLLTIPGTLTDCPSTVVRLTPMDRWPYEVVTDAGMVTYAEPSELKMAAPSLSAQMYDLAQELEESARFARGDHYRYAILSLLALRVRRIVDSHVG